jgi:hypothetical protein
MMMSGMGNLVLLWSLLSILLMLGFSYIIWVMALKETGYVKTTGLVIACGIAALTVILFLYGSIWGGQMKQGMMGGGMMMGGKSGMGKDMPCMNSNMSAKEKAECMTKRMGKGTR